MLKTTEPANRYVLAALISITIGAVLAMVLYWSAQFGSSAAANALVTLSLPKYNPYALLVPDDLNQVRLGMEMMLGVVMLEVATVLFVLSAAVLWLVRRR